MTVHIALLRGINVGGNNIVRMSELREALTGAGLREVQTYIQSGNIIAQSDLAPEPFAALIKDVIKRDFDVDTWPAVLTVEGLEAILKAGEAGGDATHAHAFVYRTPPDVLPKADEFVDGLGPRERVIVGKHAVILYAPDGLARSKFAVKADKLIAVPVTARNFRTMGKLNDLVKEANS